MFSRQRTSSVSSNGPDRLPQSRSGQLQPGDRATHDMSSVKSNNGNGAEKPEPKRKSFMGIHFGGHKDKDRSEKESSRLGRQSMDQTRPASLAQGRNSMSDVTRPPFAPQSSNLGNRVVSQPSFPSPGAGRPQGYDGDAGRPDYPQERTRSISMGAPHAANGGAVQFPGGNLGHSQTGSPQSQQFQHSQQPVPTAGNTPANMQNLRQPSGGIPLVKQQRENVQTGSFAVAGRSQERLNPPGAPLQAGQAGRPINGNNTSGQQLQSQQSLSNANTAPGRAIITPRSGNPALAQVLQSYIDLNTAQASKLYASSPPELEMIFARQTNGAQPK
jgi:hypothetical protein